jgi:uracil phosphoribosyltransferase
VRHIPLAALILVKLFKATGGSAMKAVEVLQEQGVPEERIIFINLVCLTASFIRNQTFYRRLDCGTRRFEEVLW